MDKNRDQRRGAHGQRSALSFRCSIGLAITLGFVGGYADLVITWVKFHFFTPQRYLFTALDFVWTVPLGHVVLLVPVAMLLSAINYASRNRVPVLLGAWILATLALWGAIARFPLHPLASLILASGLAIEFSWAWLRFVRSSNRQMAVSGALVAVLAILFAVSTGADRLRTAAIRDRLPKPRDQARNIVLIVWDTVRAHNLSALGYNRDTTPYLDRWAQGGVRFRRALTTAPWTLPSHSSLFTGYWPYQLDTQWSHRLGPEKPTLAEFLGARGYQTAAFVGNTVACSYESGLDRGFTEYHDYCLSPWSLLTRTEGGRWLIDHVLFASSPIDRKWLGLQSRDAVGISDAFSSWLDGRRQDRPFFVFLNVFDVHEPYATPANAGQRFGLGPTTQRDRDALYRFAELDKDHIDTRDVLIARDCYDNNIAHLDRQYHRLMLKLQQTGLLDNTIVILTSDHGEAFGDHGVFGHGSSLFLDEIEVPLVVMGPGLPGGKFVSTPVSLRDIPATVVDLLGMSADSPFPGVSLAHHWSNTGTTPRTSPALSEYTNATAFMQLPREGAGHAGFQMSIVRDGLHYVRDGTGGEQLYRLSGDQREQVNLSRTQEGHRAIVEFREALLETLSAEEGTSTVEAAYLAECRDWLAALVAESVPPASAAVQETDDVSPAEPSMNPDDNHPELEPSER